MYQPEISEDNIRNLYHLKIAVKKPMTRLINAILDAFFHQLEETGGTDAISNNRDGQVCVGSIQLSLHNKNDNGGKRCAGAGKEGTDESLLKAQSKGIAYCAQERGSVWQGTAWH